MSSGGRISPSPRSPRYASTFNANPRDPVTDDKGRVLLPQRMLQVQLYRRVDLLPGNSAVFAEVRERGVGYRLIFTSQDLPQLEAIVAHIKGTSNAPPTRPHGEPEETK